MPERQPVPGWTRQLAVPIARSLQPALSELASVLPTDITSPADIDRYRTVACARATDAREVSARLGLASAELSIASAPAVTRFAADGVARNARVIFLHGGGLIAGDRFDGVDVVARHAAELGLEIWTVEYPLAPEHTLPEMVDAVCGVVAAADGVDGLPILLAGQSAGGGLAAAVAVACRDRGIRLEGQMLVCPMLSRTDSVSTRQHADDPSWSRISNQTGWRSALSDTGAVPPAERADLAGMAPVYLDTGTAELFRDSIAAYAVALWANGCRAELHAWSGAFHGSDCVNESSAVSVDAHRVRREWLRRWIQGDL